MGPIPRIAFGRIRLATIIVSVGLLTGMAGAVLAQDDVDQPEQEQGTVPEAASDTASAPVALPMDLPPDLVPIIDLHFHAEEHWDIPTLVDRFNGLGVAQAGNGGARSDSTALSFASTAPGRFIPFGGQGSIYRWTAEQGERAWNLQTPQILGYLDQLEEQLRSGALRGIGELFVNNMHSSPSNTPTKYPADSPLMQRLWAMSATYQVPLSVHMEGESDSVAQMERLLNSNPAGTWIWAHAGQSGPDVIRKLFAAHPNLYCELSARTHLPSVGADVDTNGTLKPLWKQLFEDYPDRFVLGTDTGEVSYAKYAQLVLRWRTILDQVSAPTRTKIAHANAERLLTEHIIVQ